MNAATRILIAAIACVSPFTAVADDSKPGASVVVPALPGATILPAEISTPEAGNIPQPVTIPDDGTLPGTGSPLRNGAPESGVQAQDPANSSGPSDPALRNEGYRAALKKCDGLPGMDKTRCVAAAQKKSGLM